VLDLRCCVLSVAVLLGSAAWAQSPVRADATPNRVDAEQMQREQRLMALKQQITTLKATLEGQQLAGDATRMRLREIDLKVAESARALIELTQRIDQAQTQLAALEAEEAMLLEKLESERSSLAQLLRSAYAVGQLAQLKLALSQDRVGRIGRVLTYHDYFNQARIQAIAVLRESLARLKQVRVELDRTRAELERLSTDERQRSTALAAERAERETFLSTLADDIRSGSSRLDLLEADRAQLEQLLSQLGDVLADLPAELARQSFASMRGRLLPPLAGEWQRGFGERLDDGRAASGISIRGSEGASVRAVSYGRVAFSDWLRGFGMLMIIDHGDGWMSLYGHCETLLKSEGDWVQAGEVLATVGSSGGQGSPALHFELRSKSIPVDPKGWFLDKPR
jgi:septal ring factor EnvC (AmiA/AmiB activator)